MHKRLLLTTICVLALSEFASAASPGSVTFVGNSNSLLNYLNPPTPASEQFFLADFAGMIGYPPAFNPNLAWFPNGYAYFDLYGIMPGSEETTNPNWILKDQYGNWLYIPFGCSGGVCAQYAANIADPTFRAAWIAETAGTAYGANYAGVFIDDVNMNFNVSDGYGNLVTPIDSNTGQTMTYDAWRSYIATFVQQARAAMPNLQLMENTIWYAGPPGVLDADPYIQQQIATSNTIVLERGINDPGLTGGTGTFSLYAFFAYVDLVHSLSPGVSLQQYTLTPAQQEYGLAGYFLISNGSDSIGDSSTTPDDWFSGYSVNLGTPLGPRTYTNGVFQRNFTNGMVLLGEPGLATQNISLGGTYTTLDGTQVTSVSLSGSQGYVLQLQGTPQSAILNGASFDGGAISPGEVVTIPGSYSTTPQVQVNGTPAVVLAAVPTQINVIVPFELNTTQPATVVVQQGQSTITSQVPTAAVSPSVFTTTQNGNGQGAILNQDSSINSASNPAAAGTVISVYGTGFGVLTPPLADGEIDQTLSTTVMPVTATIGGIAANVTWAGAAPNLIAGVIQVNVQLPAGLPANAATPIVLTVNNVNTQPGVTVAVQ